MTHLSVALGDTLQLVLLLDSVRVAASLGGVDQLFGQALSNGLDVAERGLAGTGGEEGDGLVDSAEGRDIDSLTTDSTGGTNSGRVFAGTAVDNGVNGNLDGVLVGHEVDLEGKMLIQSLCVPIQSWVAESKSPSLDVSRVFGGFHAKKKTHDLESVVDNADSQQFLSVVAAVHHQRVGETLDDRAVSLAEALDGIAAGAVGDIDRVAEGDVVTVTKNQSVSISNSSSQDSRGVVSHRFDSTYVKEMSRTSTS